MSKGDKFGNLSRQQRKAYANVFRKKIEHGISTFKPDIIHVHHGWIIASLVSEFGIPYVITLHGTEYYAFNEYKDYQESTLTGIHGARKIMALTKVEREQAIGTYEIDPEKIIIVKSGTDITLFRPFEIDKKELLKSYSVTDTDRAVVFFGGRLTAQKGVDTLIKAAGIYSSENNGPITLIAGDGVLRGQLEELAKKLELDSVYFLGNQDHRQMAKLFNIADVVALPSKFEPFGLIAIEALACGTPVIAGETPGFRQTINEQIGSFIESDDYITLADKITAFVKEGFKEQIKEKAAEYIRENFSWENTVSRIEEVYKQNCS